MRAMVGREGALESLDGADGLGASYMGNATDTPPTNKASADVGRGYRNHTNELKETHALHVRLHVRRYK